MPQGVNLDNIPEQESIEGLTHQELSHYGNPSATNDPAVAKHLRQMQKSVHDHQKEIAKKILNRLTVFHMFTIFFILLQGFRIQLPWGMAAQPFLISNTILGALISIPIIGVITTLIKAIWNPRSLE